MVNVGKYAIHGAYGLTFLVGVFGQPSEKYARHIGSSPQVG